MRFLRVLSFALLAGVSSSAQAQLPPRVEVHDTRPNVAVQEQAKAFKAARDTKGLTELAAKYRASRERFANNLWYLESIYEIFTELPDDPEAAAQEVEFLKKWSEDEPQNITAQVCYAEALTSYAWQARGGGWSDSVGKGQWQLFGDRLAQAQEVIVRAGQLDEKCPHLFAVQQVVMLGLGLEAEHYIPLLDAAVNAEPTYGTYYTNAYRWMLPRWYGEKGDYERWLTSKADAAPEAERDLQYARLVWLAKNVGARKELVFAPGRLDWERTKRGFTELIAADPSNFYVYVAYLQLALSADDRETAKAMFDVIGGRYDPNWWKNTPAIFEAARRYAYEGGPNPYQAAN